MRPRRSERSLNPIDAWGTPSAASNRGRATTYAERRSYGETTSPAHHFKADNAEKDGLLPEEVCAFQPVIRLRIKYLLANSRGADCDVAAALESAFSTSCSPDPEHGSTSA